MNLNLEIISPTGILFKGECFMATVPSVEGEMGVMYEHEAVIASLAAGQVKIFDANQNVIKTFDVKSGFAEVQNPGKLLVLLDS
jgi:F-type H+-transporting ATPase subunit epsilon